MKKILLSLAAAALALNASAEGELSTIDDDSETPVVEESDGWVRISPDNYLFDCASDNDEEHFLRNYAKQTGSNPSGVAHGEASSMWLINGVKEAWAANCADDQEIKGGMFLAASGGATDASQLFNGKGWQISHFGKDTGKVLYWLGSAVGNDVKTKLEAYDLQNLTVADPYQAFHGFFIPLYDPEVWNENGGYFRLTMVYNFHATSANTFGGSGFFVGPDNVGVSHATLNPFTTDLHKGSCGVDNETDESKAIEEDAWNPEKWVKQTITFEKKGYAPHFLCIKQGAGGYMNSLAVFIKEIKLEWIAELPEEPAEAPRKAVALNQPQIETLHLGLGKNEVSGVKAAEIADDENAPVEYFNLQGIRVANPTEGIFIRRQGSKTSKIRM